MASSKEPPQLPSPAGCFLSQSRSLEVWLPLQDGAGKPTNFTPGKTGQGQVLGGFHGERSLSQ